jgi:hypothetical protein
MLMGRHPATIIGFAVVCLFIQPAGADEKQSCLTSFKVHPVVDGRIVAQSLISPRDIEKATHESAFCSSGMDCYRLTFSAAATARLRQHSEANVGQHLSIGCNSKELSRATIQAEMSEFVLSIPAQ